MTAAPDRPTSRAMNALRLFLRDHSRLVLLLLAMALAMKALVPSGYMIGSQSKVLTISICADTQGGSYTTQVVLPHGGEQSGDSQHAKDGQACPFSALAMASLAGADSVLLSLALAFILALGFAAALPPPPHRVSHLRPPLRGPPATI